MKNKIIAYLTFFFLTLSTSSAHADVSRMDSADLFDNILRRFDDTAHLWSHTIIGYAAWLFWSLALISMVWTYGMMALRKADIQEFMAETVRFLVVTGFFSWIMLNAPQIATSIIDSLRKLAADASGIDQHISPSSIVDVGFDIVSKAIDNSSVWSPASTTVGLILAGIILVVLTLISLNMLIILITGWILTYGGVIVLGFGGGRWTQDIAIQYYKTVLGIAMQAFTMLLLIGIGKSFIDQYYALMAKDILLKEMFVMLVVSLILLVLINKVPPVLAGMISGGGGGGGGGGGLGVGGALGAAGIAGAAVAAASAGSMANGAGGLSAISSAFSAASQSVGQSGAGFSVGAGSQGAGKLGGLAQAMGQAGKFAGSFGSHLASGAADVVKAKAGGIKESFAEKVSETAGGKMAEAISQRSDSQSASSNESINNDPASSTAQNVASDNVSNVESISIPGGSLGAGEAGGSSLNEEVASFANKSQEAGER